MTGRRTNLYFKVKFVKLKVELRIVAGYIYGIAKGVFVGFNSLRTYICSTVFSIVIIRLYFLVFGVGFHQQFPSPQAVAAAVL